MEQSQCRKIMPNTLVKNLDLLTRELIEEILSRLTITSLLRSSCVCKTWHSLIDDPRFATMHITNTSGILTPTVLLHSWTSDLFFLSDAQICGGKLTKLSDMPFKSWLYEIVGCCNGLVCSTNFSQLYRRVFVCNPVTREFAFVPDGDSLSSKVNCATVGFGFDEKNGVYKVVSISVGDAMKDVFEVVVHTLGTPFWRGVGHLSGIVYESGYHYGVLFNGNLHWFKKGHDHNFESIVAFHLSDESFGFIQLPVSIAKCRRSLKLGVLRDCLFLIDTYLGNRLELWIMKQYGLEESWAKEYVIGVPEVWRSLSRLDLLRPLGIQRNGEILFEFNNSAFWSYDPTSGIWKDLRIDGLPRSFESFPHVPSLVQLKHVMKKNELY